MITYLPRAIIANHLQGFLGEPFDFLPLYEHFARRVLEWKMPRELLIDTSGINFSEFGQLPSQRAVATVLVKLFVAVGTGSPRGAFLKRCGIRRWNDLSKPIRLRGRRCRASITHDVRERRLKEPGPNPYHPGATYAQTAYLQFGRDGKWRFILWYGYSHDSSSWHLHLSQQREALGTFVGVTVPGWLDEQLLPEAWAGPRRQRNRDHDRLSSAVDVLFGWDCYGPSPGTITTDALVHDTLDCRKPLLTKRRLGVFRRWMRADADKERRREIPKQGK